MNEERTGPVLSRRQIFGAAIAVAAANVLPSWLRPGAASARTASAATSQLSLARFAPLVGSSFNASLGRSRANLITLVEANARPPRPEDRAGLTGDSFSLVFSSGAPRLGDGTYTLRHPSIGTLALFLVPVGRGVNGPRYQAVVDHRRPVR